MNALQNRIQVNKPLAQFFARYSTWMVIALAALLRLINLGYPAKLVFDRRGRATVVLTRRRAGDSWRAEHTHFSFIPGSSRKKSQDS